ncbi:MAG: FAD-dependent oxidoreductase [Spirochaetales bacterium]|nr:FAD-dependent oxidoreductase [Spirochaetales bacterium]
MPISKLRKRDVIIAGGGPAGIIAAIAAARNGADTLLIEQNGYVGGTAAMGLPMLSFHNNRGEQIVAGIPWELITRLKEMDEAVVVRMAGGSSSAGAGGGAQRNALYKGGSVYAAMSVPVRPEAFKYAAWKMLEEAGVEVLLYTYVTRVVSTGGKVTGIVLENKSGRQRVDGKCIVDCTGDGDVAALSGAPFEKGRSADGVTQPLTMLFVLGGIDLDRAEAEGVAVRRNMEVVDSPVWQSFYRKYDIRLDRWKDRLLKDFPRSGVDKGFILRYWGDGVCYGGNMLHVPYYDASKGEELSRAVVEGRNLVWNLVRFMRENVPGFDRVHLVNTYNIGVRESRRITGHYLLTYEDVIEARRHEDDIALNGYFVDIHDYDGSWFHLPDRGTQIKDYGSYGIPYRCLLPQSVDRLLVAGRCLSTSHEAHASARVMGTCMAMGQAAGTAAALSVRGRTTPRALDSKKLLEALEAQGAMVR